MRRFIYLVLLVAAGYYAFSQTRQSEPVQPESVQPGPAQSESAQSVPVQPAQISERATDDLQRAYDNHQSNIHIQGAGTVEKILSDDNEGSRHQRFIVRLSSGKTILIAHNIDLANRVAPLSVGDQVQFSGQYEWNEKGGVVHWTHHDPSNRHSAGWIKHNAETFQ